MDMELLDLYRGYAISVLIIMLVVIGLSENLSIRYKRIFQITGGIIGGTSGLFLFLILNFISGWDVYFDTKSVGESVEYSGRHQVAAKVVETLGDLNADALGILFGLLGITLFFMSYKLAKGRND